MAAMSGCSQRITPRPARRAAIAASGAVLLVVGAVAGSAAAHDGISSSSPEAGSSFDEPISEVTIDFGVTIDDDVELALLDPDEEQVPSTTTRISDTVAVAEFDPLERQGTYIVRYLTTVPGDGHLLAGAISFTYGTASGDSSITTWVLFGVASAVVLGIGTWLSLRRARALTTGEAESESELSDPAGG